MTEVSLQKLVENGEIKATGAKQKLPIKLEGLNDETLAVYRIPLKYLYYNNENGRIRANISSIKDRKQPAYSSEDNDAYNQQIENLVYNSNKTKLNKTKKDIQSKGQLVFGYVLDDGRVIDGNRRFTALRKIESETQVAQYFEAVILPVNYEQRADKELVKRLELALQMGIESKVDYDPTDAAVDVYQTVEVDKLMNIGDYALNANLKKNEVQRRLDTVFLIRDFLEAINADQNNYQIIKDLNVYNPLYELSKVFKKMYPRGGVELENTKEAAFTYLQYLTVTGGDIVRLTRAYIKQILSSSANSEFNDELSDTVQVIQDKFDEKPIKDVGEFRRVMDDSTPQLREVSRISTDTINRQSSSKDVEDFMESVRQVESKLKDMKKSEGLTGSLQWDQFAKNDVKKVRDYFAKIAVLSKDLIDIYDEELDD